MFVFPVKIAFKRGVACHILKGIITGQFLTVKTVITAVMRVVKDENKLILTLCSYSMLKLLLKEVSHAIYFTEIKFSIFDHKNGHNSGHTSGQG